SRVTPLTDLLVEVDGFPWTTNYYGQVFGEDEEVSFHDQSANAVVQQLILMKFLELRVTTPLSPQPDPETQEITSIGEANVFPFVKVNKGDTFLADAGDGREGIFVVIDAKPTMVMK